MKHVIALLLYVSSVIALLVTGINIAQLLLAFPVAHLSSYGPRIPAIAAMHAQWLPHSPTLLYGAAIVSVLVAAGIWRAQGQLANRPFALAALAAVNYFLSMICCAALMTIWFLLPKLANLS